ncbi:hypothetical protein TcCL_ESM06585 [Trypanosoma cruzi]|nr:hypothetical protein TcCL_ESM06585 [Trypanosoma cruzi]
MLARPQPSNDAVGAVCVYAIWRPSPRGGRLALTRRLRVPQENRCHRNVRSACRQVIMRLFHLRVKLSTPIRNVRDGAGVFGAQSLPSSNDQPLLDPQLPGSTHTMGSSTRTSKIGT